MKKAPGPGGKRGTPKRKDSTTANAATDAPLNRPTLARLQIIHAALQSRQYVTNAYLRDKLDVCRQTVSQDIHLLQDRLGIPIEYDEKRHAYHLTGAVEDSALIQLPVKELIAIATACCALESSGHTVLCARLRQMIDRISLQCGGEVRRYWDEVQEIVSFLQSSSEPIVDQEQLDAVTDALQASHEVEFHYRKRRENTPEPRRVRPLRLSFRETWYLFAEDPDRNCEIRIFALCRMSGFRDTGHRFEKPAYFHPNDKLAHSIGVYGGEPECVRIRLSAFAAQVVDERRWHKTQQIVAIADGMFELILHVAINPEFEQRVLAWGSLMEVLEPLHLRQSILAHAQAIVARG